MEWVIERRQGNAHGGDQYARLSRSGRIVWGSLHHAEVFPYAAEAQRFAHKHALEGRVQRLVRSGQDGSYWLVLRSDGSHNG